MRGGEPPPALQVGQNPLRPILANKSNKSDGGTEPKILWELFYSPSRFHWFFSMPKRRNKLDGDCAVLTIGWFNFSALDDSQDHADSNYIDFFENVPGFIFSNVYKVSPSLLLLKNQLSLSPGSSCQRDWASVWLREGYMEHSYLCKISLVSFFEADKFMD